MCLGRTARLAAIYPYRLCIAILRGFRRQLVKDGIMQRDCIGLHMVEETVPTFILSIGDDSDRKSRHGGCSAVTRNDEQILTVDAGSYVDDLTGIALADELVRLAIKK